jgi:hypothetical protein
MPTVALKFGKRLAYLTVGGEYKPGDPAPSGYLDWHEWAAVQHKAGLRQDECGRCGRWKYPQELSDLKIKTPAKTRSGMGVTLESAVCNECAPTESRTSR